MSSIFTKIINREIPCLKLYEDDLTFAFMDIRPIRIGHSLIVPKQEISYFVDVEEPTYCRLFQNAKQISKAIHKATNCERVGLIVAGYEVPHFHLHMVPTWGLDDFNFKNSKKASEAELKQTHEKIMGLLEL